MNLQIRNIYLNALIACTATLYPPDTRAAETSGTIHNDAFRPWAPENYSFSFWQNGWRKQEYDPSPDILCFETGRYGLALDVADFTQTRFGLFDDKSDYSQVLATGTQRLDELAPAALEIEVEVKGRVYRAATCRAGTNPGQKRLHSARMWESGKLVQHFDFAGVVFKDNTGEELACDGVLDIVAWPGSLTLNMDFVPSASAWTNARVSIRLNDWHTTKTVDGEWPVDAVQHLTLNCNLDHRPENDRAIEMEVACKQQNIPVAFDKKYNCHAARIKGLKRDRDDVRRGTRNYDEFDIVITNRGEKTNTPFLLNLTGPANITGLCPVLCDEQGHPTGIPVQLSKNWHDPNLGAYLRAYAMIPAQTGRSKYKLRIVYGFYGTLPSASHAQLSLIGWGRDGISGNNGRWDQLAIGCWGETICFDMDMSCTDVAITDVRMLMARNGLKGRKWGWTDAGWGGDWLNLQNDKGDKLYFNELKTAYRSHGPCLTDVEYDGFYGGERQVDLKSTVRTLRTDDYARTFLTLNYTFTKSVSATNGWLFKLGRTGGYVTPQIAYGNRKGLIKEHDIPQGLEPDQTYIEPTLLSGPGPWWVAFPGAYHNNNRDWGTGSRALVIRSYRAVVNGQLHANPVVSFPVHQVHKDGSPNLDLLLTPPPGVTRFNPGDSIEMDVEVITLHRIADDYYGPNEVYRRHLAKYPRSWKTAYREALGNDLRPEVTGGTVQNPYPLIIKADSQQAVNLKINEGVGAVPVRFDGLAHPDFALYQVIEGEQVKLDQSVHGNDFWQTDFDPGSNTYSLTFNLPLDGIRTSEWILKPE